MFLLRAGVKKILNNNQLDQTLSIRTKRMKNKFRKINTNTNNKKRTRILCFTLLASFEWPEPALCAQSESSMNRMKRDFNSPVANHNGQRTHFFVFRFGKVFQLSNAANIGRFGTECIVERRFYHVKRTRDTSHAVANK